MNIRIEFETAKLLAENKYPQKECPSYLLVPFSECTSLDIFGHHSDKLGYGDSIGYYIPNKTINAPTIAEVVMWLYQKHEIWVECLHRSMMGDFTFKVSKLKNGWRTEPHYIYEKGFNEPTEAYEAAILYTLNNLIK